MRWFSFEWNFFFTKSIHFFIIDWILTDNAQQCRTQVRFYKFYQCYENNLDNWNSSPPLANWEWCYLPMDSQKWSDPSYPSIRLDTKVYWLTVFFGQLGMMLAAHRQPTSSTHPWVTWISLQHWFFLAFFQMIGNDLDCPQHMLHGNAHCYFEMSSSTELVIVTRMKCLLPYLNSMRMPEQTWGDNNGCSPGQWMMQLKLIKLQAIKLSLFKDYKTKKMHKITKYKLWTRFLVQK
jgi:hypothetical protein